MAPFLPLGAHVNCSAREGYPSVQGQVRSFHNPFRDYKHLAGSVGGKCLSWGDDTSFREFKPPTPVGCCGYFKKIFKQQTHPVIDMTLTSLQRKTSSFCSKVWCLGCWPPGTGLWQAFVRFLTCLPPLPCWLLLRSKWEGLLGEEVNTGEKSNSSLTTAPMGPADGKSCCLGEGAGLSWALQGFSSLRLPLEGPDLHLSPLGNPAPPSSLPLLRPLCPFKRPYGAENGPMLDLFPHSLPLVPGKHSQGPFPNPNTMHPVGTGLWGSTALNDFLGAPIMRLEVKVVGPPPC